MKSWIGTSGYSYREWAGGFYPKDMATGEMLRYYAGRLNAVEINNTFYRLPTADLLEGWSAQVPDDFRFALKASRRITHFKRLKNAAEETSYLLRTAEALGRRLGAILFQLPPDLGKDLPRLEAFLNLLSPGTPAAFEFRHPSWFDGEAESLLRAYGFAICAADTDRTPLETPLVSADWGYFRLRRSYDDEILLDWVQKISALPCREVYVFFKHKEGIVSPLSAERFRKLFDNRMERANR